MKTVCQYFGEYTHREMRFGLYDAKGREIGAMATLSRCEFTEISDEAAKLRPYYRIEPGGYLTFRPQAQRDGLSFGACQPVKYLKTEAERDEAIEAYFAGALKRAQKIAVK